MAEPEKDTSGIVQQHQALAKEASLLRNIASELDELSAAHEMEQLAARVDSEPHEALSRMVDALSHYAQGLAAHFAQEERRFPELARKHDAARLVESLLQEHRRIIETVRGVSERAREQDLAPPDWTQREAQVREITSLLRSALSLVSSHAEKEDEVLFIISHSA